MSSRNLWHISRSWWYSWRYLEFMELPYTLRRFGIHECFRGWHWIWISAWFCAFFRLVSLNQIWRIYTPTQTQTQPNNPIQPANPTSQPFNRASQHPKQLEDFRSHLNTRRLQEWFESCHPGGFTEKFLRHETLVLVSGTRLYRSQNKKTSYPQKLHVTLKLIASSHLKMDGWKEDEDVSFWGASAYFQVRTVSFREGT